MARIRFGASSTPTSTTPTRTESTALVHAFLDSYICTTAFQLEVEGTGFISVSALDPDGTAARDHRGENPLDNCTQLG